MTWFSHPRACESVFFVQHLSGVCLWKESISEASFPGPSPPSPPHLLRPHALLPGEKSCASHRTRRSVATHLLAVTPSGPLGPFGPCLLPLPSHHLMSSQVPPSPPHWLSLMSANPFSPHCHGKAQKWERGCGHHQPGSVAVTFFLFVVFS